MQDWPWVSCCAWTLQLNFIPTETPSTLNLNFKPYPNRVLWVGFKIRRNTANFPEENLHGDFRR